MLENAHIWGVVLRTSQIFDCQNLGPRGLQTHPHPPQNTRRRLGEERRRLNRCILEVRMPESLYLWLLSNQSAAIHISPETTTTTFIYPLFFTHFSTSRR